MYKIKYNSIKKFFVLLCIIIMMWNVPVFASCVFMEEQEYIEKQINVRDGSITFWTKGEPYLLDYRCLPELYITIKESKPGILKDGDIIYFETSKHNEKYFSVNGLNIESEGVYAKEVKTTEKESDNCIAIAISRSNNKKQGVIKIQTTPYLYGIDSNETENLPTFSLWLDADKTKENNLFSEEQNILLNECFMDVLSSKEAAIFVQAQSQSELEKKFPKLTFTIGENSLMWGSTQRELEHTIYINQNGSAMISLEYLVYIAQNLEDIGVRIYDYHDNQNGDSYIVYAGESSHRIFVEKSAIQNDEGIFENVLEQKDGINYISLRWVAKIFSIENRIVWNDEQKTITLG